MDLVGPGLALVAGILSTLSPCVLPLLPIVLGPAVSEHRFGPAALAAGLALSFVAIGLFVATIGFSLGLDGGVFRTAGAILLVGFGVVLLGAVWSPCVGPTLGAASVLAAQDRDLGQVALTMTVFGLGTALPLLLLGLLSREALMRWRGRLMSAGSGAKTGLGGVLVASGILILSGADKALEAGLVSAMPAWLTDLTTRF